MLWSTISKKSVSSENCYLRLETEKFGQNPPSIQINMFGTLIKYVVGLYRLELYIAPPLTSSWETVLNVIL